MRTSSADRVMQTMARYFDVEARDTGKAGLAAEAARRASADPEYLDALNQVLEEVSGRRSLGAYADAGHGDSPCPECLDALSRLFEAGLRRGSCRACTDVRAADSGIDVVAWLPDGARCGTEKAYALQVKTFNAARSDPEVHSHLFLVLVAAIYLDRSSLGTAGAWSMRREPSASDVTAVRAAVRRLAGSERAVPAAGVLEAGELRDPLRVSTPAEFTAALAQFRVQAGMPAYREMSRRARPGASPSTLLAVVHDGERLPSLRTVSAFVTGCGGSAEELSRFTAAWRRVRRSDSPGVPGRGKVDDGTCPYASSPVVDAGTSGCRSGDGNSTV
jgi:hypothetical protein